MKGRKKVDLVHIELIKDKTILYEGKDMQKRKMKTAEDVIGSVKKFVSFERNNSFWERITIWQFLSKGVFLWQSQKTRFDR